MLNIIIIAGFGLNCEEETKFAFSLVDSKSNIDIIHINNIVNEPEILKKYQIMAIPGGFSYGDHTGAGNAFSWYCKNNFIDQIREFRSANKLIIGICNGCQILVKLFQDDLPVDLLPNDSGHYQCEWVDITVQNTNNIWLSQIQKMRIPIAHAEGRFKIKNGSVNIAAKYIENPNGSDLNISALSTADGRILAIMPHPERAVLFTQTDYWTFKKEEFIRKGLRLPKYGDGIQVFQNAVNYFK